MDDDLTTTALNYAHFAENTISNLQQAYLKKYHPRQYSQSIQDVHRRLGGIKSGAFPQQKVMLGAELAQSDDGIAVLSNIC